MPTGWRAKRSMRRSAAIPTVTTPISNGTARSPRCARDPLVRLTESVRVQRFTGGVDKAERRVRAQVGKAESRYAGLLYDFRASEGIAQYPNANSTMRLTYGSVVPLNPSDGVHYDSRSTIAGYMEKYNPDEYEFRVDDRMKRLIAAEDWGRWGEKGTLYVNFLIRQRHHGR